MTYQQVYKAQHARLVKQNVLKAAFFSLLAGISVAAVIAFVTIFVEFNGLWTAIGAGLGVAAVLTPSLYFAFFRPNEKSVAQSLDRLGFEERAVTMLELEGDSTVMANLQRSDTVSTITAAAENNGGKVPVKSMPFITKLATLGLSVKMLVASGVVVVVAATALTFTAMPTQQVKQMFLGKNSYNVIYTTDSAQGVFYGEKDGFTKAKSRVTSEVTEGEYSERLVVSSNIDPEGAYMFAGWSDDYYDEFNPASRSDKVNMGINASAKYEKMDVIEDDPNERLGSSDGENPVDQGGRQVVMPGMDGDDDDQNRDGSGPPNPGAQGDGASSSDASQNSEVIDGAHDYQETFESDFNAAMERLAEGKDIPESLRKMISAYFESLK